MLLTASRLLTPASSLTPGWVRVDGHRVVEVGDGAPPSPPDLDLGDATVVPGFVDVHTHGGGGAGYDGGDPDDAATAVRAHLADGTTTTVASLVTDTVDGLATTLKRLAPLVDDGLLAGLHLEGPWLSPARAGAHDVARMSDPTPADLETLLDAGGGHVRMVTLAPERPGGLAAVRRLVERGVVAAVGHTDADFDMTRAALDAGAGVGTHLFNAMPPLHHRRPGPVAALLDDPDARVELVADGVHLHPATLRLAAHAKPGRFLLVTDAMAAAAAPDGDYRLGQLDVEVRDGVATLAATGAIAGSTLTMAAAVRHAVDTGLPLLDVVRAATATPAALLGLEDVGELAPGGCADLAVLDGDLQVQRVMRAGRWV